MASVANRVHEKIVQAIFTLVRLQEGRRGGGCLRRRVLYQPLARVHSRHFDLLIPHDLLISADLVAS